ncbi:MAG: biotin/lipoyl-containing protein, partial [Myxococcota bacterium]
MSTFDFKLPDIGEGVMEGEIVSWLVKPGDAVGEDEPIVEVMTDKATVTITSPKAGTVRDLGGAEGDIIAVHTTLVVLELGSETTSVAGTAGDSTDPTAAAAARTAEGAALASTSAPETRATEAIIEETSDRGDGTPTTSRHDGVAHYDPKPLATPAVRKLARDLAVDLRRVVPSGSRGRVTKEDVRRHAVGVTPPQSSGGSESATTTAGRALVDAPRTPPPPA